MSKKVLFFGFTGFTVATVAAVTAKVHASHHRYRKFKAELRNHGVDLNEKPVADLYLVPRGRGITSFMLKIKANHPIKLHGFK